MCYINIMLSNFVDGLNIMAKRIYIWGASIPFPFMSKISLQFHQLKPEHLKEWSAFQKPALLSPLTWQRLWSAHWTQWHFLSTPDTNPSQLNSLLRRLGMQAHKIFGSWDTHLMCQDQVRKYKYKCIKPGTAALPVLLCFLCLTRKV